MKKLNTKKMLLMISFMGTTPFAFGMMQQAKEALANLGIPSDVLDNINELKSLISALEPQTRAFGEQLIKGDFTLLESLLSSSQMDLRPFVDKLQQTLPKIKSFIKQALESKTVSAISMPGDFASQFKQAIATLKTHVDLLDQAGPLLAKIRSYANIPTYKNIILSSLRQLPETSQYVMLKPKIEALQVRSEYIQAKAFIASIDMAQINEGIAILGKVINGESVPTASLKVVVKATEKLRHLPSKLLVFVKNNIDMIDTIDDHLAQAGILNRLPVEVKNILPELKGHVAQAINMLETSNAQIDSLLAQAKAELQRQFMGW